MNDAGQAQPKPGFVEFQLLRHGPPHNQLLSPLTEYFALCGDHPNTLLRIPLEHSDLDTSLRALRYVDSEQTRVDHMRAMARLGAELLAKVPGLIADLASKQADGRPFVHLSIASRASELALFPFELALAPDGFPGAGQSLCLQRRLPVCMTRRSRNVRNEEFPWDRRVKILMIASDAGGPIPVLQHYALLRKLVDKWVGTLETDTDEEWREKKERFLPRVLHLMTDADVDKIARRLCDEARVTGLPFTHIHVLAHGCDLPDTDRRSGIALHHPSDPKRPDAVDGKRLAETLGCLPDFPATSKQFCGPGVVTLATCGSADQGGVVVPGASLAFELHDSGIPLVVGSQFPLTTEGSVIMTESLYRGFLSGRDPRSTIWETRRALHADISEPPRSACAKDAQRLRAAHDWGSLTVYAALPADLDDVLPAHRRRQKRLRMQMWLEIMQRNFVTDQGGDDVWWQHFKGDARQTVKEVNKFDQWAQSPGNDGKTARVGNLGILASAQKMLGLWYLRAASKPKRRMLRGEQRDPNDPGAREWTKWGEDWLQAAQRSYKEIFKISRDESWALVQSLALEFALTADCSDDEWTTARALAAQERHAADVKRRIWAVSALVELEFLSWLKAEFHAKPFGDDRAARDLAQHLLDLRNLDNVDHIEAGIRQFDRYVTDFAELARFAKAFPDNPKQRYVQRGKARMKFTPPGRIPAPVVGHRAYSRILNIVEMFNR